MTADKEKPNFKVVADNRRARFDYEIGETFEAGLMLTGLEVSRCAAGRRRSRGATPPSTAMAGECSTTPTSRNISRRTASTTSRRGRANYFCTLRKSPKLAKGVEREGMTIVPLRIYFNAKGRAKIAIALGRGKKLHDKRETEKARDWSRDKSRLMRERG